MSTRAAAAESLSVTLLLLLERLDPVDRTVFLLDAVFGRNAGEIARIVGADEGTCAQRLVRAQRAVAEAKRSLAASRRRRAAVAATYFRHFDSGDTESIRAVLAPDVIAYLDGPDQHAPQEPTTGRIAVGDRLERLFTELRRDGVTVQPHPADRASSRRMYDRHGRLIGVHSIDVADGLVQTVRIDGRSGWSDGVVTAGRPIPS